MTNQVDAYELAYYIQMILYVGLICICVLSIEQNARSLCHSESIHSVDIVLHII